MLLLLTPRLFTGTSAPCQNKFINAETHLVTQSYGGRLRQVEITLKDRVRGTRTASCSLIQTSHSHLLEPLSVNSHPYGPLSTRCATANKTKHNCDIELLKQPTGGPAQRGFDSVAQF